MYIVMLHVDYIGSKKRMWPHLSKVFDKVISEGTVFGDLFSGTGVVSHHVSKRYNCDVVANDVMYYAYILTRAKLTHYSDVDIRRINKRVQSYNNTPPIQGYVTKHFAPPKRMYFTKQNASKIDGIRSRIEQDKSTIPKKDYVYVLAALLAACDSVSNVTAVYGAYLKSFKKRAERVLTLQPIDPANVVTKSALVYNKNASDMRTKADVVYLDPPYNSRQYSNNYHVMDTIARYRFDNLRGISGLPQNTFKSKFSYKSQARAALEQLVERFRRNTKVFVMSYSSDGILSKASIANVLGKHGKVTVHAVKYPKFKSHQGVPDRFVTEYVFVSK